MARGEVEGHYQKKDEQICLGLSTPPSAPLASVAESGVPPKT